jgi:hypothetical protein
MAIEILRTKLAPDKTIGGGTSEADMQISPTASAPGRSRWPIQATSRTPCFAPERALRMAGERALLEFMIGAEIAFAHRSGAET